MKILALHRVKRLSRERYNQNRGPNIFSLPTVPSKQGTYLLRLLICTELPPGVKRNLQGKLTGALTYSFD